jgi:predicted nucleic acid-binding protein
VVTEVVYLLGTRLGTPNCASSRTWPPAPSVPARSLRDPSGPPVEPVHPTDWLRIADLVNRYRSLPLGTVDASVVACAERLGVDEVATVDRRHFTVVKAHRTLTLLP